MTRFAFLLVAAIPAILCSDLCDNEPCYSKVVIECNDQLGKSYNCDCMPAFGGISCERTLEDDNENVYKNFAQCSGNPSGFEYGDDCYFISLLNETTANGGAFEEAKDICGAGAMLATPIHPILRHFFFEKMKSLRLEAIWIGLEQNRSKSVTVADGWQIFDPHLGFHITIEQIFTPWQFDEPNDGETSKVENGTENNAIMDSGGYFRDVNKNSVYAAAACRQKLYKKQLFKPLGIGRRISRPITAQLQENTVTKCIRTCYHSWACNAISYHRTNKQCHLHLLSGQDHKNVTTIDDGGFEMLYREP